ncbi:heparinase II/III family protein [Aquimarina sp. D1M17]|uniref:alginate lyase family protein n=1 Tax=Aquimarina acroporae TaxID=2937283 RepID=UPI0020BDEF9F|nr:alginate lyase family protein [Aquimarina acroporae]MCK8523408.1 heparinase II/III family protein [Aquimarina acroporae]
MISLNTKGRSLLSVFVLLLSLQITGQDHPGLILTKTGVENIKQHLGAIPIFDKTLAEFKKEVDAEISSGIHVPIPKDMAGGYTHDRHKKNWSILYKSGVLYQLLNDTKYAKYVLDVLKEYAKMYPTLPRHPQERSYARGKIFWQCLNDANWLVYVSQAYDCVYNYISKKDRTYLEKNLFIPYANFLSEETPQFFNRIHNHSTWGNVAVGMIGLAINNDELVDRALYGLKTTSLEPDMKDNDGGFIISEDQKSGFLANLDSPFSPDGYYTEGPYYQRYAMYPFMIFAQALQNKKPDLDIFKYKDGVLIKAVYALLNLTDTQGEFFPLNDAQKGMSYFSKELVSAVDIAYHFGSKDKQLLSIAEKQNRVQLDETGLSIALGIKNKKSIEFQKKSLELKDGADGREGGVGILRSENSQLELIMKYSAQGLSHGHYDKLSFSYYNKGEEVVQDYGLARFVNIEQKNGGGYLKENKTWAKQSIAHNTIIQDQTSHFGGKYEIGSKHHSEKFIFEIENPNFKIVSATEENAYPNTKLHRTMIMIEDEDFENPLLIDIFKVSSNTEHQYDLPYYYRGQIIDTNFNYDISPSLKPLGTKNGYQHLWLQGKGTINDPTKTIQNTWLLANTFYTLSTLSHANDEFLFTRIGANDPNFNLRRDPAFILRKTKAKDNVFISTIEAHGSYNAVTEIAKHSSSSIQEIRKLKIDDDNYVACTIILKNGKQHTFILCTSNNTKSAKHSIKIDAKTLQWTGPYYYFKN